MPTKSRLKVGVDVPWVTSWSAEAMTGVSRCPSVDGLLAIGQEERPGEGHPLYSRNHLFRQRRTVREMLCPMCGKPTQAGDRWSQTAQWVTAGDVRARGLGDRLPPDFEDDRPLLDAGAIAPLHAACAHRAQRGCPHLAGLAQQELTAFPEGWLIAPLTVEAKPPPSMGPLARSAVVITFLQLIGVPDPK